MLFFILFKFQTKQPQVILSESENPGREFPSLFPKILHQEVFFFSAVLGKFGAADILGKGEAAARLPKF